LNSLLETISITVIFVLCFAGSINADPVDDAENLPATPAEVQFINRVIRTVKASVPPIDGWNLETRVAASGNIVREGKPVLVYERARDFPLGMDIKLNFKKITESGMKRAGEEKTAQDLQQEMMDAMSKGDMEEVDRIQKQLVIMTQAQMEAGPLGQAAAGKPAAKEEEPPWFYVQVNVNGDGEQVSSETPIAVPGVAKAFRLKSGKHLPLGYKYFLGSWQVSQVDDLTWKLVFPDNLQKPSSHLSALVLYVNVYGDRKSVEAYVNNTLDLDGLGKMLN
jgi:hypothetical protein